MMQQLLSCVSLCICVYMWREIVECSRRCFNGLYVRTVSRMALTLDVVCDVVSGVCGCGLDLIYCCLADK